MKYTLGVTVKYTLGVTVKYTLVIPQVDPVGQITKVNNGNGDQLDASGDGRNGLYIIVVMLAEKKDTGNTKRVDRKTYIQVTETRFR